MEEFYRISRLPPYVFAQVNKIKAAHRASGRDIIDLGMGNPDAPTPKHIVEKLREVALDETAHGYSVSRGIHGLRKAQAAYYQRRFGVTLDPETEVIATIGSKEGLANLIQAITAPGDVIVTPNPCYPIHAYGPVISGASIRHVDVSKGGDFLELLERAIKNMTPKPVAVIVNYPGNPTAETVDLAFYERLVAICKQYGVFAISDLAYCEIYFDGKPPPSILQVEGAKDIAIEFTTLSKTYSMAGWRVGFAAGCPRLIHALTRIKSYLDYGMFTPIQVAATAALNGPQDCVTEMRARYHERRDVLVKGLHEAGWMVPTPTASMFIWAPLPEAYRALGSFEFARLLLDQAEVAVAPGIGFGEYGDGHVRIALVENKQRLRQAVRNIKAFLAKDAEAVKRAFTAAA
ncbi:MAG: LL-diaminopimelate aminotransferase [Alphaproteobacteria bacterium]|nr:LL-diaminopimelate aminotransferase [Alphaproteobacteria bacterium]